MALFKRGFDAEDRVCSQLQACGCTIQKDQTLDHQHKLDVVVIRFPDNPAFYSLGIQITTNLDEVEKQDEFARINTNSRVTQKSLYLELSPKVDLEAGGGLAVLATLMEFQFNRAYANERLGAVRIYDDLTYQFYDLPARVRQLRQKALEQTRATQVPGAPRAAAGNGHDGTSITGILHTYLPHKRCGFIEAEPEGTFYLYIDSVVDPALRGELESLPDTGAPTHIEIPIHFVNAGKTRDDARYPEAKNARRR